MALQDLTPQLRTRLGRVERWVGLFVGLAVLLMVAGFIYYLVHMAQRKGWFLSRVKYFTYVESASGLKVGDPVQLMGFAVGEVTQIEPMDPNSENNVFVQFEIREPYFGYIWLDSKVEFGGNVFLGSRLLEVTKGTVGPASVQDQQVRVLGRMRKKVLGVLDPGHYQTNSKTAAYFPPEHPKVAKGYFLNIDQTPAVNDRIDTLLAQVEKALPQVLAITNQLSEVMTNAVSLTARGGKVLADVEPLMANLTQITTQLRDPDGSLGRWAIPSEIRTNLTSTLGAAKGTLDSANEQLTTLALNLDRTLTEVAEITRNLRVQVESNTNLVTSLNQTLIQADVLVQGLKKHWLLRSAFKEKKGAKPRPPVESKRGKL